MYSFLILSTVNQMKSSQITKRPFLLFNFLFAHFEKFFTFIISILITKAVGLSRVAGSRKCV